MDITIVADAISDILQCSSGSLASPATRLSSKDIQQFEKLLKGIHDEVQEANHNNSQGPKVLPWLQKVKDVVNDLNDLMEDLRHKESATATRSLIKASQNMAHRLKVTHQIRKAADDLKRFKTEAQNLPFAQEARKNERKLTNISEEYENKLVAVGRENAKKEIIHQLMLSVNNNGDGAVSVPVVTIVGVAGIGKTKLARLLYGDEEVKAYFGLQIWVQGNHETFDVESVAKRITETAINGKRFLLVLDDFRAENGEECVEKLQQKLTEASGAILITTRSNFVANKIAGGGTVKPYALQGLNEDESWSLFNQIRGQGSSNINEDVEREIVRKYCGGVPMKILTVARLINCYESPLSEAVLKEEFLHELKFTYYDQLPMHQKLCFVYCSLFPQDHEIDAKRLIHLWMAEGFLSRNLSYPQEFGLACFNDFVPFVFQDAGRDEFGVVKSYKMNRLMHELARIVAWDENIVVDSEGKRVHERVVRASFDFTEEDNEVDDKDKKSLECLEPNPNLGVLCVVGYYGNMFSGWLSSMQCLVKFSLNDCPKCQFMPPLDHLPHLRVLELRRLDSLEFISKNWDHTIADAEGSPSSTFISTPAPFCPSLKELTISDCPNLRSWWETEKWQNDRPFFTCISKLHVQSCPVLHCMPLYPYLDEELVLEDSSVKPMRDTMHAETSEDFLPFSKLKSMVIARIKQSPPERWLKNFTSLEKLQIRDCSQLVSLPQANVASSSGSDDNSDGGGDDSANGDNCGDVDSNDCVSGVGGNVDSGRVDAYVVGGGGGSGAGGGNVNDRGGDGSGSDNSSGGGDSSGW
ncbi:putative disease resistance RPP13 protein 1 [Spatholobus suberectus]|nr:putative disease resistance RPP13 protein 1 [Spatholobus suberectus]